MKFITINFLLFLFLFFTIKTVNISSRRDEYKQRHSFFKLAYRIVGTESTKIKQFTLNKMKQQLSSIVILLGNLVYTNVSRKEVIINKDILKHFKIKYDDNFKTEKLKKHLVLLINFKKLSKKLVATSKLYNPKEDEDESPDKDYCYLALLNINQRFKFRTSKYEEEFKNEVLQEIFYIMGFRRAFLRKKNIRNNFNEVPYYLIQNLSSFKSYLKLLKLTDRQYNKISTVDNGSFYVIYWPKDYNIHDIMTRDLYADTSITEITANTFNDMKIYSFNKCDVFKYKAGFGHGFSCLKPNQKCFDENKLGKDYFLEYGIYKGYKIKCYLNTKENIKNKQCGIISGNLSNLKLEYRFCPVYIPYKVKQKTNSYLIPETEAFTQQNIRLLKKSKICKSYLPRTIFFSVPESVFNNSQKEANITQIMIDLNKINENVEYENITIPEKDRKYFVTYQAPEEHYARESVMSVLNNSGIIRSYSHLNSHNILLKHPDKSDFKKMVLVPMFQKIYSLINFPLLSYKDRTYRMYNKMHKKFPQDYDYLPQTFLYPEDKHTIETMLSDYTPDVENLWLIKPKSGSLGEGIYIFQDINKTPKEYLLTRYINHPHLINNKKYDFRIYILISGIAPLRIYVYEEGLVRFASEDYILDVAHLSENYRHLTNISLNKKNKKYFVVAKDVDTEEGNRWSLQAYKQYCKDNNIDYQIIINQIKDITIKAVLSVYKENVEKIRDSGAKYNNFFHLYGLDFLPDQNLKLYFLEGNDRPSLLMGDINDKKLKPQLVADILNIVGIVPFSHDYNDEFKIYEDKENKFPFFSNEDERVRYAVDDALCELGRPRGRFELIFPLKDNVEKYEHLFEINLPENKLFWQQLPKE